VSPAAAGALASACAGMATFVGALPVLLPVTITRRMQGVFLGFGGGVMLAAAAFSLIVPGTEAAIAQGATQLQAAAIATAGLGSGALFLKLTHDWLPHEHFFKGYEGRTAANLARIWLFTLAVTLHNFPEGLAVGVSFGSGDLIDGVPLAMGIGLQNLPEGLVVALALVGERYSRGYALGISLLTGLVEPVGGLVGVGMVAIAQSFLPWAMAFAAGAMLFVIGDDIIPESHEKGRETEGTLGITVGFAVMMFLDIGLG